MDAAPDPDRRARLKALFDAAIARPAEERDALLAAAAPDDALLRRELAELLEHHERAAGFLEGAVAVPPAEDAPEAPSLEGLELPNYRLERELGRGGMGVVYLAEQRAPRRRVAVKLLRLDSLGADSLARFRREAEILARLRHPGIAQVLEAGLAPTAHGELPWIALEYAEGEPIDAWVAARALSLRELVTLFAKLCDAVDHAHQRGVVHRDLKPSNVLVDERGDVRVLDFGVARLAEEGDEPGPRTRTGAFLGTLAYAAPEQLLGGREPVDAGADVHALGVLLFELATGALPFPVDDARVLETVRAITRDEPLALRRLRPDAPVDLETVVCKALDKDPCRRYADAGALRDDLERWLGGRAVLARPPSALYQTHKLVRRHPAATVASTFAVGGLLVAIVALTVSGQRVEAQLAETADALEAMAGEFFRLVPSIGFGEQQRGSLEEVEQCLARQLEHDPGNRALRTSRAQALFHLSALDLARGRAEDAFERADAARVLLQALAASDPSDLACRTLLSQTCARIGEARRALGDPAGEEAWYARALALDEELVRLHPGDLELVEDLGWSLARSVVSATRRGDSETAYRLALRRLADAEALVAAEPDNWKFVYNLANALLFASGGHRERGDSAGARRAVAEMLRQAERLVELEPDRRDFVRCLLDSARHATELARERGDLEAAARHARLGFDTAVGLALRELRNPAAPGQVLSLGTHLVEVTPAESRRETAAEVAASARAVLSPWSRAQVRPDSVEALAGFLRELAARAGE